MSNKSPLKVVLCWHMHQPEYRDLAGGNFRLPWTYLHAIKDYIDMAAIIDSVPGARAVVNFVPILLDQIVDYEQQIRGYLADRTPLRDPLLEALVHSSFPKENHLRAELVAASLRANEQRLINRFPRYRLLADIAVLIRKDNLLVQYQDDQYFADLVTWYHLAWMGETVRRSDSRVQRLIAKGMLFTLEDRLELLAVIGELVATVVPRYRDLAGQGKVELSMTPYAHPMIPLLLDFGSARDALPELPLPQCASYPGGRDRAHWHIREGIKGFERHFGFKPQGCWPAEGGVSEAMLELLEEYKFKWIATGENVLRHSLAHSEIKPDRPVEEKKHCVYQVKKRGPLCFFRDDGLSDLIGFTYYDWHGDDAVNNLVHHLENIAAEDKASRDRVVSIVLDGENAWESYPDNGFHFLTGLYKRLSEHPTLELTTFSACADRVKPQTLERLVAGSWVYGTFTTWIGDNDKNRGWDLLCEVKRIFDEVCSGQPLDAELRARLEIQLAVCEGSDWFWWFGDYNPADSVSDFERLYRLHLANLYQLLGKQPPEHLSRVISVGGGKPQQGGVMRPGQAEAH